MAALSDDIAFYDENRASLEADHFGRWVLIHDRDVVDYFDSFDAAARVAVAKFGRGPYLIRQIGAPATPLPASVMYRPVYARSALRV